LRSFDVLAKAEQDVRAASQARYALEMALVKWIHLRKLVPMSELIAGLESGAQGALGALGARGAQGAQGARGAQGASGAQGAPTFSARPSTLAARAAAPPAPAP